ncbi:MAG: hypothetical protein AB1607_16590 [Chloroflexota bacterium]
MSFLKNLFSSTPAKRDDKFISLQVKCNRCGEILESRVDLDNDLSLNDEGNGYFSRKVLLGGNLCFQQIEVELTFDSARQLIEKRISGGEFVPAA